MSPADPTFRPPGPPGAPIRPTGRPGVDRAVERLLDGSVDQGAAAVDATLARHH